MNNSNLHDYRTVALALAASHHRDDPETTDVFLMPDPDLREIRLLEVTRGAPTTRELFPFAFGARPDLGIPFPSVVLLVSPAEWAEIEAEQLELPAEWQRAKLQRISPP
jgi:hypothetical protein